MRAEVEDPSPAVPAEVSPDTDWMAADPEPDSRPGLRGIVRIAKLRPSALVSVLFAARQRDPQQLRDFFLGSSMASNFFALQLPILGLNLPQLMIQRIDRLGLAACEESAPAAFLPRVVSPGLKIRPVKSFSAQQGSHSARLFTSIGLLQDPELIAGKIGDAWPCWASGSGLGRTLSGSVRSQFWGPLRFAPKSPNPQFLIAPVYHHRVIQLLTL